MLSDRKWRIDALIQLLVSVFLCIFTGSLLGSLPQLGGRPGPGQDLYYLVLVAGILANVAAILVVLSHWTVECLARKFLLAGIFFYLGLLCGFIAQRVAGGPFELGIPHMVLATLTFQGLALPLVAWFVRQHDVTWAEGFGLHREPARAVISGVVGVLLLVPVVWFLQFASGQILEQFGLEAVEQMAIEALRLSNSWGQQISLGLVSILIAPLAEELLFRGVLFPAIRDAGFPRLAFWGTSILFAAIHFNAMTFVPLFVLAAGLTLLYQKTGNLLAPIAAHAVFNTINFIMLLLVKGTDTL